MNYEAFIAHAQRARIACRQTGEQLAGLWGGTAGPCPFCACSSKIVQRKHRKSFIVLWLIAAISFTSASAQGVKQPERPPVSAVNKTVVNLWPSVAPGSDQWKEPEATLGSGGMERIVNVTTPTLTAYLPDPSVATGTGVIIAPGGGFVFLGINSEGHDIAKWLVARGIAAFVLKYRTVQLEGQNEAQLNQSGGARFGAQLRNHALIAEDGKYGIADGIQAVKVLRTHAAEWGISPNRIVFLGFSAGGMITELATIQPDARPNYAAPIYGAPFQTCLRYQKDYRLSLWRWRKMTISPANTSLPSTTHSRQLDTNRSFTSIALAVMAGACANKEQRAITRSPNSTTGWKRKG
jgi:acetyl esterase/lipase